MVSIFKNNHTALIALMAMLTAWLPGVGHAQARKPAVAHLQYALIGDFKISCFFDS
jgi:hypothetical protein